MESPVLAKWQVPENTAAGCNPRHSKQMSRLHQGVFHAQKGWYGKKPRNVGRQEQWIWKGGMLAGLGKGKQD